MSFTPKRGPLAGREFANEYQYRKALALARGFRSRNEARRAPRPVTRVRQARDLPDRSRRARASALQAVAAMRRDENLKLDEAARQSGTTVETMLRYAAPALEKRGGRWYARPFDRLARAMEFITPEGVINLEVRDSRSRQRIGSYMATVGHYLHTGDARGLRRYRGRSIVVDGQGYPFVTDTGVLDRLASAGELGFDAIYADAA